MANHTGIYRHGNRWRVSVMRGGQRVTRVCDTLSEATLARDQLIHDLRLRSGKLPGRATVDDVLDLWLEHVSHAAPSRRQHLAWRLAPIRDYLGDCTAATVSVQQVESLAAALVAGGRLPGTVRVYLSQLSAAYNYAAANGTIEAVNPVRIALRYIHASPARERDVTDAELISILDAASRHIRRVLVWLRLTGLRRGELCRLTLESIDLDRRVILPDARSRTKRRGLVPLPDCLCRDLPQAGPVISWGGTAIATPYTGWTRACTVAGVSGVRLHDIRRSYVSHLRRLGVHPDVIDLIIGHRAAPTVRDRYNVFADSELSAVRSVLNQCTFVAHLATYLPNFIT